MTTAATRAIQCPKCGSEYRVKAGFDGRLRCKKCNAAFVISAEASGSMQRRRRPGHDRQDQKMAVKLMFLGGGLLLVVAVIIVALSKKSTPGPVEADNRHRDFVDPAPTRRSSVFAEPEGYVMPLHPKTVHLMFLKTLGEGSEEGVRKLFLFDKYFKWAAVKYEWEADSEFRYDRASPERKKELESMAVDEILSDTQLQEYVKRFLIPDIESGDAEPVSKQQSPVHAYYDYLVKDSNDEKLFNVAVQVVLKEGLDPYTDGLLLKNWGVSKITVKYHVAGIRSSRKDRRAVDQIIGSIKQKEKDKERKDRVAKAKGPLEADPTEQDPIEGTGPTQISSVASAVKTLIDPRSSGPEMHRARTTLEDVGKPAIPFLLNALLNVNHRDVEEDILKSMPIIMSLRELTGESFGYGPPTAGAVDMMGGSGLAGATPEQRVRAVRRWFGWWDHNKKTWAGKKPRKDEEDG